MKYLVIAFSLVSAIAYAGTQSVPATVLNPSVTPSTLSSTVCVAGYTSKIRPSTSYTNGVKLKLLKKKGLDKTSMPAYELDHLVALSIGGAPKNTSNLVLQPWDGVGGAKAKDVLEKKLQCLVCSGQVPLATAQSAMYFDWQTAAKKYRPMKCTR